MAMSRSNEEWLRTLIAIGVDLVRGGKFYTFSVLFLSSSLVCLYLGCSIYKLYTLSCACIGVRVSVWVKVWVALCVRVLMRLVVGLIGSIGGGSWWWLVEVTFHTMDAICYDKIYI